MAEIPSCNSLSGLRLLCLVLLGVMILLPGLGSSGRLTYHEAFIAQGAREMLSSGNWGYPTIGGIPWLEKPPVPWWFVVLLGHYAGTVNETVARLPSALAAIGLIAGVGMLAARHYGSGIGLLAGAVQATTAWTVIRGRLAEADILLAALMVWAIVTFDRLLSNQVEEQFADVSVQQKCWRTWRWWFLAFLSMSALVKGIGFGVVLVLAVVGVFLFWQRDGAAVQRLWSVRSWTVAAIVALAWPIWMVAAHGQAALSLWKMHVWARLIPQEGAAYFAGESMSEYVLALFAQALPWTPFSLMGARRSLGRALGNGRAQNNGCSSAIPVGTVTCDRLLWVWAVIPLCLLTLAPVKNAHYVIFAQVPWSIWAALALARLGTLVSAKYRNQHTVIRAAQLAFAGLGLTYGLSLWLLGPWFNRRGIEWAFYEAAGAKVVPGMHVALFYDDWDRSPYITPFGPVPHDLAVRLFYLGRPVCWHIGATLGWPDGHGLGECLTQASELAGRCLPMTAPDIGLAIIGRDRDLPVLRQYGDVKVIFFGPNVRQDRTFALFQLTPKRNAFHFTRKLGTESINRYTID